jgi:hypothetical protein
VDERRGVASTTPSARAEAEWEAQDRRVRILVAFYALCLVAAVVAAGLLAGNGPPVAEAPLVEVRATTSHHDLSTR